MHVLVGSGPLPNPHRFSRRSRPAAQSSWILARGPARECGVPAAHNLLQTQLDTVDRVRSGGAVGWWEIFKDIAAGSIGGMAGKIIDHPFDSIKVKLQHQTTLGTAGFSGPWDCFQRTLRYEGYAGLYRGLSIPLFGAIFETAIIFTANGLFRRALIAAGDIAEHEMLPLRQVFVSGAAAGAAAALVLTPVELVKCRLQVRGVGWERGASSVQACSQPDSPTAAGANVVGVTPAPSTRDAHRHPRRAPRHPVRTAALRRPAGLLAAQRGRGGALRPLPRPRRDDAARDPRHGRLVCDVRGRRPGDDARAARVAADCRRHRSRGVGGRGELGGRVPDRHGQDGAGTVVLRGPPSATVSPATPPPHTRAQQTAAPPARGVAPPGFTATLRAILRAGGVRALYAGIAPTLLRAFPTNAAVFLLYEQAIVLLGGP